MTAETRLVLFVRYPTPGACKTRLIPSLGPEGAAALHRQLSERTIDVLRDSGCAVTAAYTGASRSEFENWLGRNVTFVEQVAGDLTAIRTLRLLLSHCLSCVA